MSSVSSSSSSSSSSGRSSSSSSSSSGSSASSSSSSRGSSSASESRGTGGSSSSTSSASTSGTSSSSSDSKISKEKSSDSDKVKNSSDSCAISAEARETDRASSVADAFSQAWGEPAAEPTAEADKPRSANEYASLKESLGDGLIKPGSKNSGAVTALQEQLNAALGKDLKVDGKFGDNTEAAVREFQQQNGLEVDGKVGENTRAALLGPEPPKTREQLQDAEDARRMAATQKQDLMFGDKISPEDQAKVRQYAEELQTDPNDLMTVFAMETGGTLDPAIRAGGDSKAAVGIIQFTQIAVDAMNERREGQGLPAINKDMLSEMTFSQQLDHARDYLRDTLKERGVEGPVGRDELYLAVFAPSAINKSDSSSVYSRANSTKNYNANRGLDDNKDGVISRLEVTSQLDYWYNRGQLGLAS